MAEGVCEGNDWQDSDVLSVEQDAVEKRLSLKLLKREERSLWMLPIKTSQWKSFDWIRNHHTREATTKFKPCLYVNVWGRAEAR